MAGEKGRTDWSGKAGVKVQIYPELKIRPNISGEVTYSGPTKGSDAGPGGVYTKPSAPWSPGPRMTEGVKAGQLYYRAGQGSGSGSGQSGSSAADDDDGDDDNAKGGLIRNVKGPKPKGSKDDGKINAQRGEFVIRKSAVKQHGVPALTALNAGRARIVMTKPAGKPSAKAPSPKGRK